jgi:hypothetical protein
VFRIRRRDIISPKKARPDTVEEFGESDDLKLRQPRHSLLRDISLSVPGGGEG